MQMQEKTVSEEDLSQPCQISGATCKKKSVHFEEASKRLFMHKGRNMHKQPLHQMCNPLHAHCYTSHYGAYLAHHTAQSLWNYAHVQELTTDS